MSVEIATAVCAMWQSYMISADSMCHFVNLPMFIRKSWLHSVLASCFTRPSIASTGFSDMTGATLVIDGGWTLW